MIDNSTGLNSRLHYRRNFLAKKSAQSLVGFYEFLWRFCAYSTESQWLLPDEKMLVSKVWRLPEVIRQTGLSRSTIYEMIKRAEFPRQFNLGPRAVGWISDEVLDWIDTKTREARHSDITYLRRPSS